MAEQPKGPGSDDTLLWSLIAWVLGIIGALVAYLAGPKDPRVMHWVRLSIAFFLVDIIAYVVATVAGLIPFIGFVISLLIWIGVIVVYIVGIIKIVQREEWKPPLLWDLAEKIPI